MDSTVHSHSTSSVYGTITDSIILAIELSRSCSAKRFCGEVHLVQAPPVSADGESVSQFLAEIGRESQVATAAGTGSRPFSHSNTVVRLRSKSAPNSPWESPSSLRRRRSRTGSFLPCQRSISGRMTRKQIAN